MLRFAIIAPKGGIYTMKKAVIDIGTNSVKLTLGEAAAEGGVLTAALPAAGELSITAQEEVVLSSEEVVLSSVELTVPS